MSKIRIITSLIFALISATQSISQGGLHEKTDWKIIKTPAIDVIYAPGMQKQASRVAAIINYQAKNNMGSIGEKSCHKVPMLIRNNTVVPNGYVGLAPHRSELYATPPEDINLLGSVAWLDLLAIHEFRHVQQNYNSRRGVTAISSIINGQQGWAGMSLLAIPRWFSEGDAVIAETAMTSGGRGRTPSFSALQRALARDGVKYNYQKASNGSFDELVPNRYPLGYMMLTYLRNQFGNEESRDAFHGGAKFYRPYPYSTAMKKEVGLTTTKLYNRAWDYYQERWAAEVKNLDLTKTKLKSPKTKVATFFSYPQYDKNGDIIAYRQSNKETASIVRLERNKVEHVTTVGSSLSDYFHHANGILTWTELSLDPRRVNTNYSDIIVYDMENDLKSQITSKGKFFSPALSPEGDRVAAVHIGADQAVSIKVLGIDGSEQSSYDLAEDLYAFNPTWTPDGREIVFIRKELSRLQLVAVDVSKGKVKELGPQTSHVISAPRVVGEYVYFSASFSQIDNIYRVPLDGNGQLQQVTSVPIGALQPAVSSDGESLLMIETISRGTEVTELKLDTSNQRSSYDIVEPAEQEWMDLVSADFEGGDFLADIDVPQYEEGDYKGFVSGLSLHSWGLAPSASEIAANLQWNNLLDDLSLATTVGFNYNENTPSLSTNLRIARYYPIFDFDLTHGLRSTTIMDQGTTNTLDFNETSLEGSVTLPWTWIQGNYSTDLRLKTGVSRRLNTNRRIDMQEFEDVSFNRSTSSIRFRKLRRTALQNTRSRFGIDLLANYTNDLREDGDQTIRTRALVYLPGISTNHSLRFNAEFQEEPLTNRFQISDVFQYARGYGVPRSDEVFRVSADYMFPLFYPDFGIAGITYFRRLRLNLFYDYSEARLAGISNVTVQQSTGAELIFDTSFLNLLPISYGLRYSQRLNDFGSQAKGGDFGFFLNQTF